MPILYDPASPTTLADPYPVFAELREADALHWSEPLHAYVVTRYADAVTVLRDPRFSADRISGGLARLTPSAPEGVRTLMESLGLWLVFSDPPRHTRLRRLINKAFTPAAIERLRPATQEVVDTLVDALPADGNVDLIPSLANPLPAVVIARIIGVPEADHEQFKAWSDDLAAFVGGSFGSADKRDRAQRGALALGKYVREMLHHRRPSPGSDILSALIAAEERGDMLGEDEIVATCVLLLFAGHETTTNLIGNGTYALLRNPSALAALRADPASLPRAVEELLRYDGPIGAMGRIALEEVELSGGVVPAGKRVNAMVNAANRDPREFASPDALDFERSENRHIAFGIGIHYCLGAPLARLEGQLTFEALLRRFPNIELDGEPAWNDSLSLRGLRSLPLALRARPGA